ncbi:MAG: ATP-binding protein [Phycisphaerales bacterium]
MAKKAPPKPRKPVEAEAERPAPRGPVPGRLDDLIGQDRAVSTLRTAVAAGRLHHAWIFAGPLGVGKFTGALAFARELLTPVREPEGEAARLLAAGLHPDLHIVVKELSVVSRDENTRKQLQTNIPLHVVREFLTEPAGRTRALTSDSAAAKVFIVDEADMMAREGQNTLLKTLEEPPPGTVIILVTPSEHELYPTIRSRCQRVPFIPLDDGAFARWLGSGSAPAGGTLDAEDREFLDRFAGGAPGVAEVALRTGIVGWRAVLAPMLSGAEGGRYTPRFSTVAGELIGDWAEARVKENPRASKDAANRAGARWMFRLLGDHCRARLRAARDARATSAALDAIRAVDDAERHADASVNFGFVMENFAAQLVAIGVRR